jgi:ATP-dependent DNA ligase
MTAAVSDRALPTGFVPPCLPTKATEPPSGSLWLHEIKHDGFRVIARKDGGRVRLSSRPGNDLTWRFPLVVEALARLRSRSVIIDGEAVSPATTPGFRASIGSGTAITTPACSCSRST